MEEQKADFNVNEFLDEDKPKKRKKVDYWKIFSFVLLILLIVSVYTGGFGDISLTGWSAKDDYSGQKVKVDMFVMSKCPGGTHGENVIKPVLDKLSDVIDFELNFVASYENGVFSSLHGDTEVQGDIIQLCAEEYYPNKFMDLVICMNKDYTNIPDGWEKCGTGFDVDKIKACADGDEGKELLSESIKKTGDIGVSPTIHFNGEDYKGVRNEDAMMRAVCDIIGNGHSECKKLAPAEKIKLVVIDDKLCEECGTQELVDFFNQVFPNLDIKKLDYEDSEAQKIIKDNSITLLPAFLFDKKLKNTNEWKENTNIQTIFNEKGDNMVVISKIIDASHDPLKEVCDNGKDDRDQDGLVDCDDDECKYESSCSKQGYLNCAKDLYGLSEDTIIFYYGNFCGWCAKMKPGVEQLEKEGYKFYWAESTTAEQTEVVDKCFGDFIGGGVPQFVCVKSGKVKSGAFVDADKNLDLDAMREWIDGCLNSQ